MDKYIKRIIKKVKKGDQEAFSELVELYKDKVYQISYRMLKDAYEAEDIAQEAFIRAYTNISSYDPKRKFSTWLFTIVTNLSIDRIRKRKPDYFLDAEKEGNEGYSMYSTLPSDEPGPEEKVEKLELQNQIQDRISSLPPLYRSIIVLRYIEELSIKEIGHILNIPEGTVKTRIHRGREALRKQLGRI